MVTSAYKICPACKQVKHLDEFRKTGAKACKSCLSAAQKEKRSSPEFRQKRNEYQAEYMQRYRAADPEREAAQQLKGLLKEEANGNVRLMAHNPQFFHINGDNKRGFEHKVLAKHIEHKTPFDYLCEKEEAEWDEKFRKFRGFLVERELVQVDGVAMIKKPHEIRHGKLS